MEVIQTNPPDWNTQKEDIFCPLCEYNLRGLVEPRCPECGFVFTWFEIFDAKNRVDEKLFEYARHKKILAFFRTLLRTIPAWSFWRKLNPASEIRTKRVQWYYWLTLSPMLAFLVVRYSLRAYMETLEGTTYTVFGLSVGNFHQLVILDGNIPAWAIVAAWIVWTQLMYYCFIVLLPTTTLNAKIRTTQLWRCVVYCYDAGFWLGIAMWLAVLLDVDLADPFRSFIVALSQRAIVNRGTGMLMAYTYPNMEQQTWVALVAFLIGLLCAIRLLFAYVRYLRLPHAELVIISFQIVSFLFLLSIPAVIRYLF